MCKQCVKEEYPERDTMCLDTGTYMMNFKECVNCKRKDEILNINRQTSDNEEAEVIVYQHVCQSCNHVIADHEYRFKIEEDFQLYEMYCSLCGTGEDTRSIMPDDPRRQQALF